MVFTGKIKGVDTNELAPDKVVLSGSMFDRYFEVEVRGMGIGELFVGQFGLQKDEVTVRISDGGDQ